MVETTYDQVIRAYSDNAADLARKYTEYDRTSSFIGLERVLQPSVRRVLDVGAGNGIDALAFASGGRAVVAVEPSDLIDIARATHDHPHITWVRDSLPDLATLAGQEERFDLVFLNRVFMHVPSGDQRRALGRVLDFLAPGGFAYLVIRHGPSAEDRLMFPVALGEIDDVARARGMAFTSLGQVPDYIGRPGISWSYSLIQRG